MFLTEMTPQTEAPDLPYPPRRCFNIYTAAQYCACKSAAIEEAVRSGKLKAIRIGRNYVITRESLDKFIDEREEVMPHVPPSILARRAARILTPRKKKQSLDSAGVYGTARKDSGFL
jgi:excisionase family DNA binding protein